MFLIKRRFRDEIVHSTQEFRIFELICGTEVKNSTYEAI